MSDFLWLPKTKRMQVCYLMNYGDAKKYQWRRWGYIQHEPIFHIQDSQQGTKLPRYCFLYFEIVRMAFFPPIRALNYFTNIYIDYFIVITYVHMGRCKSAYEFWKCLKPSPMIIIFFLRSYRYFTAAKG
jgi:hypothetical protein